MSSNQYQAAGVINALALLTRAANDDLAGLHALADEIVAGDAARESLIYTAGYAAAYLKAVSDLRIDRKPVAELIDEAAGVSLVWGEDL